ncbi:uncharacterized protein BYT42DRAFT_475190, partial [Radiomyces spectabilis]|uniref:uncharacterized protein n=1 Tax=Radiomyces spectabilis TaxID=64574 RepID=UPI002220AD72
EKGKTRPEAVIPGKPHMDFKIAVAWKEVKTYHGSGRHSLCMDTLRLAIFTKNAIDVNKLDGVLAFQIH